MVVVALAAAALACTCGPLAELTGQIEATAESIVVPTIEVPDIEIPTFEVPTVEVPDIEVPDIDVPDIDVPPLVGEACDSRAMQIEANSSYDLQMHTATGDYPANCLYYCLPVPDGQTSLAIDLRDFDVDLDLYVGYGSIETVQGAELVEGETFYWKSNEGGTDDELVNISSPDGGLYYIEVCSYDGTASPFELSTSLR